jgi:MATE family multidrug resistance protein
MPNNLAELENEMLAAENQGQLRPLSFAAAMKHILKTTGPFTLSNLSLAAYTIGNGIVLGQIGEKAVASGPLMATFAYSIFSTVNGILYATGIFIGDLNGLTIADPSKAREIGSLMRDSWLIATGLAVPSLALMLNSGAILEQSGIAADVAKEVQDYFTGISYGLIPIYLNFCDQQLTLGLNDQKATLISGIAYSIMAAAFGYPLALGAFGLPRLGTAGMGYGASISGLISLLGLRAYLQKEAFARYGLYAVNRCNLQAIKQFFVKDVKDFLKVGAPIGLQNLSEWGSLAILSLLAGQLGSDVLKATQVSIIPVSAFNVLILALAQATGVSVADCLGAAKGSLLFEGDSNTYQIALRNSKILGAASLSLGSAATLIIGALFIVLREQILSLFLGDPTLDPTADQKVKDMAENMLIINGAGIITDTVRNVAGGGLRGYQDVNFVPIVSFIMMSVVGLSLGATLSLVLDEGADSLFITRYLGILVAAMATLKRFFNFVPEVGPRTPSSFFTRNDGKSYCCSFFNCFKKEAHLPYSSSDSLNNEHSRLLDGPG